MNAVLENAAANHIREQAAQRWQQLGWPTTRLEEWKYTNLAPLQKQVAGMAMRQSLSGTTDVGTMSLRKATVAELVFVDGIFDAAASDLNSTATVRITTMRQTSAEVLDRHYARYADYRSHPLTALNTANAQDGVVMEVTGGDAGFVHLIFVGSDGYQSHPRNLIVVGRGAVAAIVETYTGTGTYFTNAVTEIFAGDGSIIDHTRLEDESREAFHVGTVQIHQERASAVTARSFIIGGALVRNEVNITLSGEGASLVLDGLYVAKGKQHIDNHTVIDHEKPHCDSTELFKGILDENARGIFDGRIVVHAGAQKTAARQTNKNLLLSETAIADSKPTLEIFNDDVKCTHGSTIGQLDEEALFYLQSRGIGNEQARGLLVFGFASEIVERISVEPVKEHIRRAMFHSLPDLLPERREKSR